MPRYVVLRHENPLDQLRPVHWDLMLEKDGVLWTWALLEVPRANLQLEAQQLADHRVAYLEYEGPISGGRGEVTRIMSGEFEFEEIAQSRLAVCVASGELARRVDFERQGDSQRWNVTFDDGK